MGGGGGGHKWNAQCKHVLFSRPGKHGNYKGFQYKEHSKGIEIEQAMGNASQYKEVQLF